MDKLVQRFLTKIRIADLTPFQLCYFDELSSDSIGNKIIATLHCDSLLPYNCYVDLFEKTKELEGKPDGFKTLLSFSYKKPFENFDRLIDEYSAANEVYELGDYKLDKSNKSIIFSYAKGEDQNAIENERTEIKKEGDAFKEFLHTIGVDVTCAYIENEFEEEEGGPVSNNTVTPIKKPSDTSSVENFEENVEDDEDDESHPETAPNPIYPSTVEEVVESEEDTPDQELEEFRQKRDQEAQEMARKQMAALKQKENEYEQRLADEKKYYPVQLKDIDNLKKVIVSGVIFKTEMKTTKKGTNFLTIEYTDNTDSISSTIFENKTFTKEVLDSLKVGQKIQVKGRVDTDKYTHRLAIFPDRIKLLPPDPPRQDLSSDKRVELHCHTNMSALDGISSIKEYCKLAKQFGMKAVGLTDHGVVQAFPDAQDEGKNNGVKILYGCELYMVDSHLDITLNPKDINLSQAEYVIFDLETTGLSAHYDRIIEFGATKYSHGAETDKIDFFINPDRKLRDVIIKKTNITQAMVDSGRPIKEALKTIVEYFGDAVIIDHNAAFDIGFLNEALKNNGLPPIKNPVIDTLPLSRYMFPNQRNHTLEAVARTLNIYYDATKVHRAIYDAEVLEAVYLGLLGILSENNPNLNMKDLSDLTSDDVIKNARPKHVIAYAKNAQGIKDLYKIISISSTDYLSDVPHTPRWLIEQNRKNLLIGSACFNGEVFQAALTKSSDVLKETMKFYDYIEVQPPACYSWLINDGQISSQDNLLMILKDLIQAAREINKMVVATSDCHYANPEQKIYRDIYIFAKGLKGAYHPLNPFRRKNQKPYPNPDQYFLSTQEMKDAFKFLNDDKLVEEIVVTNTNKIADMMDDIKVRKDRLYPPNIKDCDKNLKKLCFDTAHKIYGEKLPEVVEKRLDEELNGILGNGYEVIYWIASVLVRQVNAAGHLVGSRGSVGSSLVATMSGITEVNPLPPYWLCSKCKKLVWADTKKYADGFDLPDMECPNCHIKMMKDGHNIPFATFLGFHAEKVPDIDLNFPSDFQSQAHEMTKQLMGADNVFKAGTIQTTEEKNAIGYVKGYFEYFNIDPRTIRPAEIDRLAAGCVGVKRTTGQHPGGIIVIPSNMDVFDFTPYQYPANNTDASWRTTHYDFHKIHDNVLKFDELGHVDPYAIKMMCDMANIDWKAIPLDDLDTLSIFYSTKALKLSQNILKQTNGALGLPEFGTKLARKILAETQPRGFGDLVRISGLSHGTNVFSGNAEDMILSGKATLRDVIGCRDDIMIQLNERWGVPLDKSFVIMELVRHGRFVRDPSPKAQKATEDAMKVMRQYNVDQYYIDSCAKIAYLFPKGHAVAYCMMAVRVAWFKVHHPEIFYAVYYTLRCDGQYNLLAMQRGLKAVMTWLKNYQYKRENHMPVEKKDDSINDTLTVYVEMVDRGVKFGKISIAKSDATKFTVDPITKEIIPPFSAVDSLGEKLATEIVKQRKIKAFDSIDDFEQRCGISSAISTNLRNLGAYDDLPQSSQMTLDEFM